MRNMKTKVAGATLVVAGALIVLPVGFHISILPSAHAQENSWERRGCRLETLKGGYGLMFDGFGTMGQVPAPISAFSPAAGVGVMTFDGSGGLSLSETVSHGGAIAPLVASGTYTVNPDCTGSLTAVNAANYNFVIVDHGRRILAINLDQGRVAAVELEKQ